MTNTAQSTETTDNTLDLTKTVYYTSELSAEIRSLRESLNSMKGLTVQNFAAALPSIKKLSIQNLCLLYASDHSVGQRANVENEILRGVIRELLERANIVPAELPKVSIVESESVLQLNTPEPLAPAGSRTDWRALIVCTDKTIRAREVFEINFPVPGHYRRNLKRHSSSLTCLLTQVYFTDRVGMPLFLSSLSVHFEDDDYEEYGIRERDLTISERSFQTTALGWTIIFNELLKLADTLYAADALCLRKHFSESFNSLNLIENEEIDERIRKEIKKRNYEIVPEVIVPE